MKKLVAIFGLLVFVAFFASCADTYAEDEGIEIQSIGNDEVEDPDDRGNG